MKGDFTRFTFGPRNHFIRVLMQQGRVQLDADWNEQTAILLHYLQSLAADLIGPHGGPTDNCGFGIVVDATTLSQDEQERLMSLGLLPLQPGDFLIGKGHYYVDGILCENGAYTLYSRQPDLSPESLKGSTFLVYLDVWERHITHIEDDTIREVALGGPDTATRAKVVWQVKVTEQLPNGNDIPAGAGIKTVKDNWEAWVDSWQPANRGELRAKAKEDPTQETDPCIVSPEARYRGAENQLYRVEIHKGGEAWDDKVDEKGNPAGNADRAATFKWSRDNGSVVFPILKLEPPSDTTTITLEHLGRDDRSSLRPGDWVEIVDDDYVLRESARENTVPLLRVKTVDRINTQVILEGTPPAGVGTDRKKHPLLRRWDHRAGDRSEGGLTLQDGAALIIEGEGKARWLVLEDGVQIQFQPSATYRPGDYWLIPARTATGDVEWPGPASDPEAVEPHGVEHHYAPLAIINTDEEVPVVDCRRIIESIVQSESE